MLKNQANINSVNAIHFTHLVSEIAQCVTLELVVRLQREGDIAYAPTREMVCTSFYCVCRFQTRHVPQLDMFIATKMVPPLLACTRPLTDQDYARLVFPPPDYALLGSTPPPDRLPRILVLRSFLNSFISRHIDVLTAGT